MWTGVQFSLWKPSMRKIYVNGTYRSTINGGLGPRIAYSDVYINFYVLILVYIVLGLYKFLCTNINVKLC
jgi:hypothetical protein